MASNETQNTQSHRKQTARENDLSHLEVISQSIGKIFKNSKNEHFKIELSNQLNVKYGRRKKSIQTETMKLLKNNYQWICECNPHKYGRQSTHPSNSNRSVFKNLCKIVKKKTHLTYRCSFVTTAIRHFFLCVKKNVYLIFPKSRHSLKK